MCWSEPGESAGLPVLASCGECALPLLQGQEVCAHWNEASIGCVLSERAEGLGAGCCIPLRYKVMLHFPALVGGVALA
jgi:hypothetical protein